MTDHESIDTYLAAEAVEAAIDLLDRGKPLLARNLLRTLHERLLVDDGMAYREVMREHFPEYVVNQ